MKASSVKKKAHGTGFSSSSAHKETCTCIQTGQAVLPHSKDFGNGSHSETLHTQKQHLRHHTFRDETNRSPVQNKGKELFLPFHSCKKPSYYPNTPLS